MNHGSLVWRVGLFAALSLLVALFFFDPIHALLRMAMKDELYSYIPLIPFISAALIVMNRKAVFADIALAPFLGLVLVASGGLLFALTNEFAPSLPQDDYFSGAAASAVVCIIGCFVGCFGTRAFKAAVFPLLFLFWMAPIPSPLLDRIIVFLQVGSTEMAHGLFKLSGAPFYREGFCFHLPGVSVEVAKQCSGIRSSVSLVIVSLLMSRLVLRTYGMRALLVAATIPITLFKNGVRIVTLTLLGAYVDPRVLDSQLHRSGGIPIFALALTLLFTTAWVLRRWEARRRRELTTEAQRHRGSQQQASP